MTRPGSVCPCQGCPSLAHPIALPLILNSGASPSKSTCPAATPALHCVYISSSSRPSLCVSWVRFRAWPGYPLAPLEQPRCLQPRARRDNQKGTVRDGSQGTGQLRRPDGRCVSLLKALSGLYPSAQAHGNVLCPSSITNTIAESSNHAAPFCPTHSSTCLLAEHQ